MGSHFPCSATGCGLSQRKTFQEGRKGCPAGFLRAADLWAKQALACRRTTPPSHRQITRLQLDSALSRTKFLHLFDSRAPKSDLGAPPTVHCASAPRAVQQATATSMRGAPTQQASPTSPAPQQEQKQRPDWSGSVDPPPEGQRPSEHWMSFLVRPQRQSLDTFAGSPLRH